MYIYICIYTCIYRSWLLKNGLADSNSNKPQKTSQKYNEKNNTDSNVKDMNMGTIRPNSANISLVGTGISKKEMHIHTIEFH
jgi:hypothetical protein